MTALVIAGATAGADDARAACSSPVVPSPCIEVTVPASFAWGDLGPGTATSAEQSVLVTSNAAWGMRINSDRADGRPAQWTGSGYAPSPRLLTSPMQWGLTRLAGAPRTPTWTGLSSTQQTVVSNIAGTGCTVTTCPTTTVGVTYRQPVSYADRRLSPDSYRLSVVYTATHGW